MSAMQFRLTLYLLIGLNSGFAQFHPTNDTRTSYSANLILVGDAAYTTSQMILERLSADQISGPGVTSDYATQQVAKAIAGQVATDAIKQFAPKLYGWYQSSYLGYVSVAYTVVDICLTIASSSNAQSRDYFIFTPADASYRLNFSIPGDLDKPCSMIKVYYIDTNGIASLKHSEEIVASDSMNFDRRIVLPRGLCRINVSLGSGSVNFHTAGTLDLAMLDNPTQVTWSISGAPATIGTFPLLGYLPNIGDTAGIALPYALPPRPSNMLNGAVVYTNIRPAPGILPSDATNAYLRIDIYGEPTDEQLALLGTWPELNMKASSVGDPVMINGSGVWRFTRLPDYIVNIVYRAVYHPY